MTAAGVKGADLSRAFFTEVVEPLLSSGFPGVPFAAARIGTGSDVLGLDDATSRDHDWGLRLNLFVPASAVRSVCAALESGLPDAFQRYPTRFPFTGETVARHHVDVAELSAFVVDRLGFDPRAGMSVRDWLSLSGQAVLELTAGPVFVDAAGELEAVRRALAWYPADLWRYVLASDWARISQELPLMGRAADVGDEVGSRIIAARLAHIVLHLAFLVERQWPPYAKWFGSAFNRLELADAVGAPIAAALDSRDAEARQAKLVVALEALLARQNALGLTSVSTATVPFWNRPYVQPEPRIAAQLIDGISDPEVRRLPRGRGAVDQVTDNVDILVDPGARRAAVAY